MWKISPSQIKGELEVPPSKSQSMRALLFALLAKGKSRIDNLLDSPDVEAMLNACHLLGASVVRDNKGVEIEGLNGSISGAEDVIHAGNSGLVFRFIGAVAALGDLPIIVTGDSSIRNRRPISPLLEALSQLEVEAYSTKKSGGAPIFIRGPIRSGIAVMDGADSQPVSGLLIAAAFSKESIEIQVKNPGEKPWIDLTLHWFRKLGIPYKAERYEKYILNKQAAAIDGFKYSVPADWSSLAYPIASALLTESEICIQNVDFQDPQGDKKLIFLLQKMGASIEMDEGEKRLVVKRGGFLKGSILDINDCIDALPILAVIGCFAKGKTRLTHCGIARKKESDRIGAIVKELKKMGGRVEEEGEDIVIHHSQLKGAELESHADHRIVLSLAVAALAAEGESTIHNVEYVNKSYPFFHSQMQQLGAKIEFAPLACLKSSYDSGRGTD